MTAARETALSLFEPIAADYLARPGVDIGPMFGSEGLRVRGKVFAFVGWRGALVVKVPAERADALTDAGAVERMTMQGHPMREWIVVSAESRRCWPVLTAEAYAYVDAITPRRPG